MLQRSNCKSKNTKIYLAGKYMTENCDNDRASRRRVTSSQRLPSRRFAPDSQRTTREAAMTEERKAVLVRITGRVQGVCFRVWTRDEAERLGLTGWVRNESDGSVTALIAGPDAAIDTMLGRFWKGPPGASVASVASEDASSVRPPVGFQITH
jgi:acylphosphatase